MPTITKWGFILVNGRFDENSVPKLAQTVAEGHPYPTYVYGDDIILAIHKARTVFNDTGKDLQVPSPFFEPEIISLMTDDSEPHVAALKFRVVFIEGVRDYLWNFAYHKDTSYVPEESDGRYDFLTMRTLPA